MKIAVGKERVNSLFIDNNNIYVARKAEIEIYDKGTNSLKHTISVGEKGVQICIDENYIYCTSNHNFIVYNKQSYELLHKKQFGYDISSDLRRPVNDKNNVYFPIRNGEIIAINKHDFNSFSTLKMHPQTVWGMCVDENYLYTGCVDTVVRKIAKQSFKPVFELKLHKKNVQRLAVNENCLFSTGSDFDIVITNKHTGKELNRLKKVHNKAVNGLFIHNNYLISSCQAQGLIKVFSLATFNTVNELNYSVDEGGGIVFDSNKVYIALKKEKCILVMDNKQLFNE